MEVEASLWVWQCAEGFKCILWEVYYQDGCANGFHAYHAVFSAAATENKAGEE